MIAATNSGVRMTTSIAIAPAAQISPMPTVLVGCDLCADCADLLDGLPPIDDADETAAGGPQ